MKLEHMLKEVLVSEGAACRFMEPMSRHTTFRIGGPAEAYVCPGNEEELGKVICLCREHGIPWRVLGNGSNLLVSDRGIEGVVIAMEGNWLATSKDVSSTSLPVLPYARIWSIASSRQKSTLPTN